MPGRRSGRNCGETSCHPVGSSRSKGQHTAARAAAGVAALAAVAEEEMQEAKEEHKQRQPSSQASSQLVAASAAPPAAAAPPPVSSAVAATASAGASGTGAAAAAGGVKAKFDKHAVRIAKGATNVVFGSLPHREDIERYADVCGKLKRQRKEKDNAVWAKAISSVYEVQCTFTSHHNIIVITWSPHSCHIAIT